MRGFLISITSGMIYLDWDVNGHNSFAFWAYAAFKDAHDALAWYFYNL